MMCYMVDEVLQGLNGSKVFSELDLTMGYHQLEVGYHQLEVYSGLYPYQRLRARPNHGLPSARGGLPSARGVLRVVPLPETQS